MNWQNKLQVLIDAYKQGNPSVRFGFDYSPPLGTDYAPMILQQLEFEFGFDVPKSLRTVYELTDGMVIAFNFHIFGLADGKYAYGPHLSERGTLKAFNHDSLHLLQENLDQTASSEVPIRLIFGSDEVGDCLCLSDAGAVVRAGYNTPTPIVIADSLDTFLDDICLGPGYIHYYGATEEGLWVAVLKELGFL